MNKVKSLEFKKLLKELEFIESDFDYRNEIISEADSEFIKAINLYLEGQPELKKVYDDKITEKVEKTIKKYQKESESFEIKSNESPQELEDDDNISYDDNTIQNENEEEKEDNEYISRLKKLHREVVKITHPDKVKIKRLNELYIKCTECYNKKDLLGVFAICSQLDIPYEITDNEVNMISVQISTYRNKISFLESTYTWHWYNCNDGDLKNQILLKYIHTKLI